MDWLNVGSNGFAQVGDIDYYAKNRIEMIYLLEQIGNKFPIPAELKTLCRFAVKAFPHDFGTYHEIVLHYDDITIGDGYDEEDNGFPFTSEEELVKSFEENAPVVHCKETLHEIFWDWFHDVESFDMETEEINEAIKAKYFGTVDKSTPITIGGKHLVIVQRKKAS